MRFSENKKKEGSEGLESVLFWDKYLVQFLEIRLRWYFTFLCSKTSSNKTF